MPEAPKENREVDVGQLSEMDTQQLVELHRKLFGEERVASNAGHLRRKIAWHIQAAREGGLPDSARQYALVIARGATLRVRISENAARRKSEIPLDRTVTTAVAPEHDVRLPLAGSLLMKDYRGRTIIVRVLNHGFEYDGRKFTSLSAVAQDITGTKWNGWAFFGLAKKENRIVG
ncbi:MAG: DUF2924 domain-containing protein [Bryobacteraceae bacterium]|nr:DUF2924 domain-containing protein [Bryobacteraceae bacterium]